MATKQQWKDYLEQVEAYAKELKEWLKNKPEGEVENIGSDPPPPPPPPPGN